MPPYRLQTLLAIRERKEEEAKQAFALATQAVAKAKEEQRKLEEDLEKRKRERNEKIAAYMKEVLEKGTGAGAMASLNRFEQRLKDEEAQVGLEIEKQKSVVRAREKEREQRRLEMAEAAKEKKAIEKHKEKWVKEVKHEREMREELVGEEIGNSLFLARRK